MLPTKENHLSILKFIFFKIYELEHSESPPKSRVFDFLFEFIHGQFVSNILGNNYSFNMFLKKQ